MLVATLALTAVGAGANTSQATGARLLIRTVPPVPGVQFAVDGRTFVSDAAGVARVSLDRPGTHRLALREPIRAPSGVRLRFSRWLDNYFSTSRPVVVRGTEQIVVGFDIGYLMSRTIFGPDGRPIDTKEVTSVLLTNSFGGRYDLTDPAPQWLPGVRVVRRRGGLEASKVLYSVDTVMIRGANAVNRGQQRFFAEPNGRWRIGGLLYPARVSVRDALFGFPMGSAVRLTSPDGRTEDLALDAGGSVALPALPRGDYTVSVRGAGFGRSAPLIVSRPTDAHLVMFSYLDLAVALAVAFALVLGLLLAGRSHLRRRLFRTLTLRRAEAACIVALALLPGTIAPRRAAAQVSTIPRNPVPVLAYYYIWFNPSSWNRAKIDYPIAGRYSSDDAEVMRRHIRWAKDAGIGGFIVSWKSTDLLNARLDTLVGVAQAENFKLAIDYQALDFTRRPLPAKRIRADLVDFAKKYAEEPAFDILGRPLAIISGTWNFSPAQVAEITRAVRPGLLVLASERNASEYARLAHLVDGDAYYWSSINPYGKVRYAEKLAGMGAQVHASGGIWIAPAAPGFDARAVGGKTVVDRKDGTTLRLQLDAAFRSSPDAVGLISWNEFSENTHLEPSRRYGARALAVLADVLKAPGPTETDFDSSSPQGRASPLSRAIPAGAMTTLSLASIAVIARRRRREGRSLRESA